MHSTKFSKNDVLEITPLVSFDWYVIGYCISHFDKRCELTFSDMREENIDLMVKGLKSSPTINRSGNIHLVLNHYKSAAVGAGTKLVVAASIKLLDCGNMSPEKFKTLFPFIQPLSALLPNISSFTYLKITGGVSDSDLAVLTNLVQSHPTEKLILEGVPESSTELAQLVVSASNLKNLTIIGHDITGLLPHKIKNVKELTIPSICVQPLAVLFPNTISLTYLAITGHVSDRDLGYVHVSDSDLAVLTNIVQSHPTLEVLVLHGARVHALPTELAQLVVSASNLKNLTIFGHDITELLPHKIKNVKKLAIPGTWIQSLAVLLLNATSLTYLEITGDISDSDLKFVFGINLDYVSDNDLAVLTNIVQSHPTLEVLEIDVHLYQMQLSPLVKAANNSQLKELRLRKDDYDQLPSHIKEAHKQLLKPY